MAPFSRVSHRKANEPTAMLNAKLGKTETDLR